MRHRRTFPSMIKIVPATERGAAGTFYIQHHKVTEAEPRRTSLSGGLAYVPPGNYCGLKRAARGNESWDTIWMSDTPTEQGTNYDAYNSGRGAR